MPTSGVRFAIHRNFDGRITICQIVLNVGKSSREASTICSEKTPHQKSITPQNYAGPAKSMPEVGNFRVPTVLVQRSVSTFLFLLFLMSSLWRPFFVPYHPGNLCLPVAPFGSHCPCETTFNNIHVDTALSFMVQRRSVIDVFIHRDGAR